MTHLVEAMTSNIKDLQDAGVAAGSRDLISQYCFSYTCVKKRLLEIYVHRIFYEECMARNDFDFADFHVKVQEEQLLELIDYLTDGLYKWPRIEVRLSLRTCVIENAKVLN
jgi:hypothetical protein